MIYIESFDVKLVLIMLVRFNMLIAGKILHVDGRRINLDQVQLLLVGFAGHFFSCFRGDEMDWDRMDEM